MKRTKKSYDKTRGLAKVKFSPDQTKAAVFYEDVETHPKPYKLVSFPDWLVKLPDEERQQTWFVDLTKDKNEIWTIRPAFGLIGAYFVEFASKEGSPPTPKLVEADYVFEGRHVQYDYQTFTALYKVIDPKYGDMQIPLYLRYNFREEDGLLALYSKGTHTEELEDWLKTHNVFQYDIPYKDNNLPDIQKLVLKENVALNLMLKNGYVDSWYPLQNSSNPKLAKSGWDAEPPWDAQSPDETIPEVKESEEFEW